MVENNDVKLQAPNFEFYCIFMWQFPKFSQFWNPSGGEGVQSSLTYEKISEKMLKMKVLHFSILNNILQHEINEKPCWTELFFI